MCMEHVGSWQAITLASRHGARATLVQTLAPPVRACEVHVEEPVPDISSLALNYRNLIFAFSTQLLLGVGSTNLGVLPLPDPSPPLVRLLVTFTHGGIMLALAIYAYRTARSLGSRAALAWAIAMPVPVVNLIALIILSSNVTQVCRRHGIPVGFFGPRIS